MRVAKADVPTDANLAATTPVAAELVEACEAFTAEVNARVQSTRRPPVMLHALPEAPYTAALGETRKVSWSSTVSFGAVTYSVHTLEDRRPPRAGSVRPNSARHKASECRRWSSSPAEHRSLNQTTLN